MTKESDFWAEGQKASYELTMVMTACIRSIQVQVIWNPNLQKGVVHEVPSPAKELLAIVTSRRGKVSFLQDYSSW